MVHFVVVNCNSEIIIKIGQYLLNEKGPVFLTQCIQAFSIGEIWAILAVDSSPTKSRRKTT